jgi:xylulokinase
MRGHELLVGIDLGTGSMKGIAVTATGELVADARAEYPMHHPQPGWNENDPLDWETALSEVLGRLARDTAAAGHRIRGIGLVAQRDPFVMVDSQNRPTGPAISWTDGRTGAELARLTAVVDPHELIDITGGRPVIGGGLVNLMWAAGRTPQVWQRTARVTSPKDYLLSRLGGTPGTDPTTPTRSLAFDVRHNDWSTTILGAVGIEPGLFDAACHQPWQPVGTLDPDWARRLDLPTGITLAGGSADDHAAALGSGAIRAGQRSLGTGTCSSWRAVVDAYRPDPRGRVDCSPFVVPGLFMREATIDSVGSSLRWFRDIVCPELRGEDAYQAILAMAARAPRGAEGVQFFPFVDGARRAPFFQSGATAGFLGVTGSHTRDHLARAVIESIALLYIPTLDLMGGADGTPLTIVDGEAASPFWNQVKADVMGTPVRTPVVLDAAAMGAAVLAAVAAGMYDDVPAAADHMVRWTTPLDPDPVAHQHYRELWQRYAATVESLRAIYETELK